MPAKPTRPQVTWRDGVPFSGEFDDLYYSTVDGQAESVFVFLNGIGAVKTAADRDKFVVGETGFGTGLNFLTTWHAWRAVKPKARLFFISAEAFPLRATELEQAHKAFPQLSELSEQLRAAWPPASNGFHYRSFDNEQVSLLLMFGDAETVFSQLNAKVDAWYLDGFAPARNPAMWSEGLFNKMAQLSNTGATIATFTAAGSVRRGLEAQGFSMRKTQGFGKKREHLIGSFHPNEQPARKQPNAAQMPTTWCSTPPASTEKIVIIGDGIAGSCVAYALARRGLEPTLLAPNASRMKSSTLPAAILAPQLLLADPLEKAFFYAAFSYAVNHPAYKHAFAHKRGTEYLPSSPQDVQKFTDVLEQFNWGEEWLTRSGDGLIIPKGGTVDPKKIFDNLTLNTTRLYADVARLERCTDGWCMISETGETITQAQTVVLATGVQTPEILAASSLIGASASSQHPSIRYRSGQLECIPASAVGGAAEHTLTYGGYLSAAISVTGFPGMRTVGSSYEKLAEAPSHPSEPTKEARQAILSQCTANTGAIFDANAEMRSWTGVRATAPDHMPYVGPIPDWADLSAACQCLAIDRKLPLPRTPKMETGLYCLTALGSKGFQYGPLLGEYLAAMICGDPSPIPQILQPKLHPARGFVRDIIRGNALQNITKP